MSSLYRRIDATRVRLASAALANMLRDPGFRDMVKFLVAELEGLSDVEAVTAVRDACDLWLSSAR